MNKLYSLTFANLFFTLLLLVTPHVAAEVSNTNNEMEALMAEFFDISQSPQKTFALYIEDLIKILKQIPQSETFCGKLNTIKTSKNSTLVGLTFLQYKKFFPDKLIQQAMSLGKDKLLEIFYKRTGIYAVKRLIPLSSVCPE